MKRLTWPILAVAVIFTAAGAWFGAREFQPGPAAPSAVDQFYSRTMPDAAGKAADMKQWKGRPLVLNFWATWCAPCVEEMPELTALQAELQAKNVQILGIGIDNPANISAFADKYKIGYPLYVAGMEGSELSRQLGNQAGGLPFTVLVDASGKVKKTYLGRLKMEVLRQDIAAM
jgi:thiol-disulfide isomerase/thioredoxin